ncbi:MAG: TonB-dependent receptor [Gemmatimonadaceae bacterium]
MRHRPVPRRTGSLAAARLCRAAITLTFVLLAAALEAQTGSVTGRVTDAESGQPISDVQVRVTGTLQGALTRSDGSYRLQVVPGRFAIRAYRVGYSARTDSVTVTGGGIVTQNFSLPRAPINLDQVVVTGTRASDRTVLDAPVPIDVLSSADIRQTGLTETSQVLQMLAPSLNFPRPTVNDGTDHVRPATLRGLGPDQTLVLINGKRRHTTALVHVNQTVGRGSTSVDLNAIPVSAIERIEILRDGAAAQYGSDAIAGVINIILKSEQQTSISGTVGQVRTTPDGGGDYRDGELVQVDANFGRAFRGDGFFHVAGEFRDRDRTNRARADTTVQCFTTDPNCSELPDGTDIYDERVRQSWQGDSESRDWTFFLNSEIPLESGVKLYGFGGFGMRDGLSAGFFRRPTDDRTIRNPAFYPNGFLPLIQSDIKDYSGAIGAKGNYRGWGWNLGGVYGGNSFEFSLEQSANVSLGLSSPKTFYAGALRDNQGTINLDLVRPFTTVFMGPLNVAIGAELRRDGYKLERGDVNSFAVGDQTILDGPRAGRPAPPFSQVFPGFRPVDEVDDSRTNVGAYVDVEATPIERLLVAVAGRVENYSDFGSTVDGKLAARLDIVTGLALRGAVQTGFRAPSLAQSNFSSVATNFVLINGVNTPFEIRTFAVGSPGARLLGAKDLEPEESVNLSAGVTLQPISNFSLSADYYNVDIDDRIVLSGNFIDASVRTLLENNGIPGVAGARYFTNAIDTRTKGVDVVLNYGMELEQAGLLRFTGGFNHNETSVTRVSDTPPQLAAVSTALFDRVQRNLIERGQPRNSVSLTLNHVIKSFATNLHTSRFGEITIYQSVTATAADPNAPKDPTFRENLDQRFGAKWVTDLAFSYRFFDRLGLTVGANNVFDVYPDTVITPNTTRGIYRYSNSVPFGFNGRYLYVRASYDLTNVFGRYRREERE